MGKVSASFAVLAVGALTAMALTVVPGVAAAGFPSDHPEKFQISVAGTNSSLDTQVSIGPPDGGIGATITFEDLLDMPIRETFLEVQGSWKIGARRHIDVFYLDLGRTSQAVVDEDITLGKYTFQTGATVQSSFDSKFIYVAYRHDFLQTEPVRISGSIGINTVKLEASVSGNGGILDENGQSVSGERSSSGKVNLPVPLIGFQMDWAVSKHSVFQNYIRLVGIDSRDIRGGMTQVVMRYHYFVSRNVGLGLGYEALGIGLPRYRTDDAMLRFNYGIRGITAYLQGAF